MKQNRAIKITLLIIAVLIFIYLVTIPWRNYTAKNEMKKGDEALVNLKYTLAVVHYQKAKLLRPTDKSAVDKQNLAQNSAKDILALKDFLTEQNGLDLLALINSADSKTCNLETDRKLIENNLSQIAKINLEFCANDGPKNYDSWLFLGIANQKISEDSYIFKELKPNLRQAAADAYAKAYGIDPINKTAIEYSISVNKIIGNQAEVDRWQKLLDSLNKISQ